MMHNRGGKIVLWGIILTALVFTAIRTIHFLQMTFPPDQQYVAYIALGMFDVGVLAWLYYAINSAEGASQRAIAFGMIFVCMLGVLITTIMDMTLVSARNGYYKVPPEWFTVGLWAVIIVIAANVAAGVLVHLVDPEQKKRMEMQSVKDQIHNLTLQHIRAQKDVIAPQIAQRVAADWGNSTYAQMTAHIPGMPVQSQLAAPQPSTSVQPVALPQTGQLQQVPPGVDPVTGQWYIIPQNGAQGQTDPLASRLPQNGAANQNNGKSQ